MRARDNNNADRPWSEAWIQIGVRKVTVKLCNGRNDRVTVEHRALSKKVMQVDAHVGTTMVCPTPSGWRQAPATPREQYPPRPDSLPLWDSTGAPPLRTMGFDITIHHRQHLQELCRATAPQCAQNLRSAANRATSGRLLPTPHEETLPQFEEVIRAQNLQKSNASNLTITASLCAAEKGPLPSDRQKQQTPLSLPCGA